MSPDIELGGTHVAASQEGLGPEEQVPKGIQGGLGGISHTSQSVWGE